VVDDVVADTMLVLRRRLDVVPADAELIAALDALSADDRELVRLWAWEQLAPRELAVVLGISANAASIRLHRATQRLAQRLDAGKNDRSTGHKPVGDHTARRGEGG
jgi:RNA polymerase sigma-70 factor (ECF subfamily)